MSRIYDLKGMEESLVAARDDYRQASEVLGETYEARAAAMELALATLHAWTRGDYGHTLNDQRKKVTS